MTKFDSNKIRLNIENIIDYENKSKKGIMDILFINKTTTLEYELDQNSLNFSHLITKIHIKEQLTLNLFTLLLNLIMRA